MILALLQMILMGQEQCYQHRDSIAMLVILSAKSGSAIFSDIFVLTTLFFILTTFSDIFPDVADIFVFGPSAIFCRCRCLQHWSRVRAHKSRGYPSLPNSTCERSISFQ